jgi:hypothetical protein
MNRKVKTAGIIIAIPVGYALLMRVVFGLDIVKDFIKVMSVTFLFTVPFIIGFLTVALSPQKDAVRISYATPIGVFFGATIVFAMEGWACWLMILPVFLAFASLGGLFARFVIVCRKKQPNKLQVSLLMLLPFALAPFEKLIPDLPARYEAYSFIDIHAPAPKIWANVVRVYPIPQQADRGGLTNFLGFPRPIRAELDYAGVGGSRQAIFSKGLVFKEVVLEYTDQKKMHFSISADPHQIPSTTMDKHVVIGGDYFNVLDGTYELTQFNDTVCRLHLYSHFTLKTTFNFYASWWAGWIMKDIQNNILQVIQTRCEGKLY